MENKNNLKFEYNFEKALEAVVSLGGQVYTNVVFSMYYADKYHLNRYGYPITGDMYIKYEQGLSPSGVWDILSANVFNLSEEQTTKLCSSVMVGHLCSNGLVFNLRKADLKIFSKSERKCLNDARKLCDGKTFEELKELQQQERAWKETELGEAVDYRLLIEEGSPCWEEFNEEDGN